MFERSFIAGWGDMDFNSHMRNTAFLDRSADSRMMYFAASGFPVAEFARRMIGPVVMKDEIDYRREIHLLEEFRVTLRTRGLSADGSRFMLRNDFYRDDGRRAASVTSMGGWLDLRKRKLIVPPDDLQAAMEAMSRTDDFDTLPSSIK